ncbi:hypothetical protein SAMN04487786_1738 [Paenisporosarcina quisquiliarum]|nr:hypothetical protein SAMN04487786_1738 [Paenisporosarcina quisquiliarum]
MNGHFALLNRLRDGSVLGDFIREEIRKQEAGVRGEDRLVARLKELRLQGESEFFRMFVWYLMIGKYKSTVLL